VLVNHLAKALDQHKEKATLSNAEINSILQQFTADRLPRIKQVYKIARLVVRMHARHNLFLQLMGRFYVPYSGDVAANKASKAIAHAPYLEFLPLPTSMAPGWTKFRRSSMLSISRLSSCFTALATMAFSVWIMYKIVSVIVSP